MIPISIPDLPDNIIQDELRRELDAILKEEESRTDWAATWRRSNPHDLILPRIYCGGEDYLYDENAFKALHAAGVTHVLDCRAEAVGDHRYGNARAVRRRKESFVYLNNGIHDDFKPKPVSHFQKSIDFGYRALQDPQSCIYVHCAAGINRGPSSCYAVLRTAGGCTAIEAELLLRLRRPCVRIAYLEDAERAIQALARSHRRRGQR